MQANIVEQRKNKTHYVQIVHDGKYEADNWTPWLKCGDSKEETAQLAIHKFMRESGYLGRCALWDPFEVMVYVADDNDPKHPNGTFLTCHGFKIKVTPQVKGGDQ